MTVKTIGEAFSNVLAKETIEANPRTIGDGNGEEMDSFYSSSPQLWEAMDPRQRKAITLASDTDMDATS